MYSYRVRDYLFYANHVKCIKQNSSAKRYLQPKVIFLNQMSSYQVYKSKLLNLFYLKKVITAITTQGPTSVTGLNLKSVILHQL